jgi:hypothetical protein
MVNNSATALKSFASESRYIIVANLYPSKSKKTLKILDLTGHLVGIALRYEIIELLDGKRNHVNVVLFRDERLNP